MSPAQRRLISSPHLGLFVILFTSTVSSQSIINNGCLSLANSKACQEFSEYYIGVPALSRYGLSTNYSMIDDFDNAVYAYTVSARDYITNLNCFIGYQNLSLPTYPYARYSSSRFCAGLIQDSDSSLPCNYNFNVNPKPLCKSTCLEWLASVQQIVTNNNTVCPNQSNMQASMEYFDDSCSQWVGFTGAPGNCINGRLNEPDNCGFKDTKVACTYCQGNSTDTCCQSLSCPKTGGLSVGAIIGIVIAVIAVLVGLGVFFFFCCKKKKHIRKENSFSFKTYIAPSQRHPTTIDDQHDNYSGNKVLLQDDHHHPPYPHQSLTSSQIMTTMGSKTSQNTGYHSHLSDPFGDHYEVISLANNANSTNNNNTTASSTPTAALVPLDHDSTAPSSRRSPPSTLATNANANAVATTTAAGAAAVGAATSKENGEPAYEEEFYKVVHPYPPQVDDELGLQVGDIVCLAMSFDDGWALGFNVTTGLKGVFPLVCVELIPPSVLEQLLIAAEQDTDGQSSFSSKVLIEDDDSFDQHQQQEQQEHQQQQQRQDAQQEQMNGSRLSRSSQLAISIRRIREDMRRSMSLSSSTSSSHQYYHHSPLSATNSIRSKVSSPLPSQAIPRRTASIRHQNYVECESPTSPTHQTPLFHSSLTQNNQHHHHQQQQQHPNESFEMYNQRLSKQES